MVQTDILEYIRKTPHNSNVNVVKGMLNTEGGGGGSSDFSTASVTIVGGYLVGASASVIKNDSIETEYEPNEGTHTFILYKGSSSFTQILMYGNVSVNGAVELSNIQHEQDPETGDDQTIADILITGDCTITIS